MLVFFGSSFFEKKKTEDIFLEESPCRSGRSQWFGSVRPKQPTKLPLANSGKYLAFCSSVPSAVDCFDCVGNQPVTHISV